MIEGNEILHPDLVSVERICVDCGKPFLLSAGERRFYKRKELPEPKRCRPCRDIKRDLAAGQ